MILPNKKIHKTYKDLTDMGIPPEKKRKYIENSYNCFAKLFFMPTVLNSYIKKVNQKDLNKNQKISMLENLFWG